MSIHNQYIHYYQDEGGENPQKSEKTITFVYDNDDLTNGIVEGLQTLGITLQTI